MMATAAGASILLSNRSGKAKRKSYAREEKLTVVNTIICTRRPIVEHQDDFVHVVPLNDAFMNQDRIFPPCHDS